MQQQQQNNNNRTSFVQPWQQYKFEENEVTPTNYHRRSRRGEEVQLPLPEANPIIRANILLEESMRHNWSNNARVFQQHAMLKAQSEGRHVDPRRIQEELEFMWFQFRCEWQQLRTDVLSEMFRIPVPECLKPKDPVQREKELSSLTAEQLDETLRAEARAMEEARTKYMEDLRQAFYPTTLMELFQKDLAPFEADMNLCLLPSGRGHWAQLQALYLYQQHIARQAHEAERLRRQQLAEKMTLANLTQSKAPEIGIELCEIDLDEESDDDDDASMASSTNRSVDISNYHLQAVAKPASNSSESGADDASSVCGLSSAASAISSSRSLMAAEFDTPVPSPAKGSNNSSANNRTATAAGGSTSSRSSSPIDAALKQEDIAYPTKPQQLGQFQPPPHMESVMETLTQLTTTEGLQCPLEYHSVRYEEETRAKVFMSRRERKAYILAAMPQGRLFMTV